MPFPACERAIYINNPLERVICQLRFPPILAIETGLPSKFQDQIRDEFPNYLEKQELGAVIPKTIMQDMPQQILNQIAPHGFKSFEFSTDDDKVKVNLTRTFLSLSSRSYSKWEDFLGSLTKPFNAVNAIYAPPYFTRIGLRYIDVIDLKKLGLPDKEWSDLLQPYVLGMLASDEIKGSIQNLEAKYEFLLNDETSRARVSFMLLEDESGRRFVIDMDLFNGNKMSLEDSTSKLEYFHERAYRLFRWCITDELHEALGPETK